MKTEAIEKKRIMHVTEAREILQKILATRYMCYARLCNHVAAAHNIGEYSLAGVDIKNL